LNYARRGTDCIRGPIRSATRGDSCLVRSPKRAVDLPAPRPDTSRKYSPMTPPESRAFPTPALARR